MCQGYAVCCRWLFFFLSTTGITLSILAITSCNFVTYDEPAARSVGLFSFWDPNTQQCQKYPKSRTPRETATQLLRGIANAAGTSDGENTSPSLLLNAKQQQQETTTSTIIPSPFDTSEQLARLGASMAPLTAILGVLLVMIEFCLCRCICLRLIQGFLFMISTVFQTWTFLWFNSSQYCAVVEDQDTSNNIFQHILHHTPCHVGEGAIFSFVAAILFFQSGALLFCTPKPNPQARIKSDIAAPPEIIILDNNDDDDDISSKCSSSFRNGKINANHKSKTKIIQESNGNSKRRKSYQQYEDDFDAKWWT